MTSIDYILFYKPCHFQIITANKKEESKKIKNKIKQQH